jgi:hypothetical protein
MSHYFLVVVVRNKFQNKWDTAGVTVLVGIYIKNNNVMPAKAGIPFPCFRVAKIIANDYKAKKTRITFVLM